MTVGHARKPLQDRLLRYLRDNRWRWRFDFEAISPKGVRYQAHSGDPQDAFIKALVPADDQAIERIIRTKGRPISRKDRNAYMKQYMRKYRHGTKWEW
jgi:hypothetical protein